MTDKYVCPHCGSKMDPLRTPLESSWGGEIHYVCFNDECSYFCSSWETMESQGVEDAGYRCRMDPRGDCGPIAVWSRDALKDLIVTDEAGDSVLPETESAPVFSPDDFSRDDTTPDMEFYQTNPPEEDLDSLALSTIEDLFARMIPTGARILDLMAGRDSHVKNVAEPRAVVGLGADEEAMKANASLTDRVIHDLNADPHLPFDDDKFDVVVNTISVQYMTNPVETFREVGRVLKTSGLFMVVFSNRMLPSRAVKIWRETEEPNRVELVQKYFDLAGRFSMEGSFKSVGKPRPADDKYYSLGIPSDPIYVLWGSVRK